MKLFNAAPAVSEKTLEADFTEIVNRHVDELYNFARYMVSDKDEANDIVQSTFLVLFKNWKKLDRTQPVRAWLYKVTRNNCLDFLKKKKALNFSDVGEELELPEFHQDLESMANYELIVEKFKDYLTQMPANYREVMLLKYFEDMTFEQIAEVTGTPVNTAKSNFYRGKTQLNKLMKEANLWT